MKLAIIRIRGIRSIKPKIKKTLELLNLRKPNHCVIFDDTPYIKGMLNVVKDYVTFGQIGESELCTLLLKRGKKGSKRLKECLKEDEIISIAKKLIKGSKIKDLKDVLDPVFMLKPPSKGYKSIKHHYPKGELGKRPSISSLIKRMA